MKPTTLNRALVLLSVLVVSAGVAIGRTATVAAFGCNAAYDWCCWPPYPATPLYGAAAGEHADTDCATGHRFCWGHQPYAYFDDCHTD